MKKFLKYHIFLALLTLYSQAQGQKVDYLKVHGLEQILNRTDDKLFVVNFWATWCAPCVKEFPVFEKVSKNYNQDNVEFIMISLDFPGQIEKQLIPFLRKNNTSLSVAVMMDMDYDSWIQKVDPSWQGQIPATLIFNNKKKFRNFHPGEVNESELIKMINVYL